MMQRSRLLRGGGGGIADKMFPGYKDKIWARLPQGFKEYKVKGENNKFESEIASHRTWQGYLLKYKDVEKNFVPSAKFRKPNVDWRRQMERGTMHFGRWYEGPNGTNYLPGNTHDRLTADVRSPFTDAEWEDRKQHRSFDLMKFGYGCLALFLAYRVTNEWPVVWCDDCKDEDLPN
ncbi:unnamed protein product [Polarella glacialis]|uniref:Uncharacterized protein n=2 Tax=Polarella glacialis TaxID=89957 RepID=A0A813KH43_POLGL|nr:unnamed protein product [Polarella glacialis]CAE8652618.1 unnamed protein product [Polarella glacialis]CAE8698883.1 unnamed protein product [Polarella glacialis]|mmetsp:Transcript_33282/g.53624  ORF Transcript_33282/g.53624 Transcript_33282/m.53624 type:complete len:176 (+) Transcript_33282:88-615(+)|eukprot:CAMPEP_0115088500 /NCGR_PEP_ID=MMETSP0227-20121206/24031_1 /TAXON_ID=89957 /ORGANISM="Polarella glacialis, Strain CCMP 1383" /LENGTH=175 /DNA_ID=CAMNT_0002478787 /DNA_START=89 /DNA_END=616 /DNA_ORIENTATION=+